MTKILFFDRFGELNYADVSSAYVSCFQEVTRLVCGGHGWDLPREQAEDYVRQIANAPSDTLLDLTGLGPEQ